MEEIYINIMVDSSFMENHYNSYIGESDKVSKKLSLREPSSTL